MLCSFKFPFPSGCSLFWRQFLSINLCFPKLWWAPSRCSPGKFSRFWEWAPSQHSVCCRFPIPTADSSSVILTLFIIFKSRGVSVSRVGSARFPVLSASVLSESSVWLKSWKTREDVNICTFSCYFVCEFFSGFAEVYWSAALLTSCWLWCKSWGSPPAARLCLLGEILSGPFSLSWSLLPRTWPPEVFRALILLLLRFPGRKSGKK